MPHRAISFQNVEGADAQAYVRGNEVPLAHVLSNYRYTNMARDNVGDGDCFASSLVHLYRQAYASIIEHSPDLMRALEKLAADQSESGGTLEQWDSEKQDIVQRTWKTPADFIQLIKCSGVNLEQEIIYRAISAIQPLFVANATTLESGIVEIDDQDCESYTAGHSNGDSPDASGSSEIRVQAQALSMFPFVDAVSERGLDVLPRFALCIVEHDDDYLTMLLEPTDSSTDNPYRGGDTVLPRAYELECAQSTKTTKSQRQLCDAFPEFRASSLESAPPSKCTQPDPDQVHVQKDAQFEAVETLESFTDPSTGRERDPCMCEVHAALFAIFYDPLPHSQTPYAPAPQDKPTLFDASTVHDLIGFNVDSQCFFRAIQALDVIRASDNKSLVNSAVVHFVARALAVTPPPGRVPPGVAHSQPTTEHMQSQSLYDFVEWFTPRASDARDASDASTAGAAVAITDATNDWTLCPDYWSLAHSHTPLYPPPVSGGKCSMLPRRPCEVNAHSKESKDELQRAPVALLRALHRIVVCATTANTKSTHSDFSNSFQTHIDAPLHASFHRLTRRTYLGALAFLYRVSFSSTPSFASIRTCEKQKLAVMGMLGSGPECHHSVDVLRNPEVQFELLSVILWLLETPQEFGSGENGCDRRKVNCDGNGVFSRSVSVRFQFDCFSGRAFAHDDMGEGEGEGEGQHALQGDGERARTRVAQIPGSAPIKSAFELFSQSIVLGLLSWNGFADSVQRDWEDLWVGPFQSLNDGGRVSDEMFDGSQELVEQLNDLKLILRVEGIVTRVPDNDELFCQHGSIRLLNRDALRILRKGQWLSDDVINMYFVLFQHHEMKRDSAKRTGENGESENGENGENGKGDADVQSSNHVRIVDTMVSGYLLTYDKFRSNPTKKKQRRKAESCLRNSMLASYAQPYASTNPKSYIFPLHLDKQNHWALVHFTPPSAEKAASFDYYDSAHSPSRSTTLQDALYHFLASEYSLDNLARTSPKCWQQSDSFSCGVFMLHFTSLICSDRFDEIEVTDDIDSIRQYFAINLDEYRAIAEAQSQDERVQVLGQEQIREQSQSESTKGEQDMRDQEPGKQQGSEAIRDLGLVNANGPPESLKLQPLPVLPSSSSSDAVAPDSAAPDPADAAASDSAAPDSAAPDAAAADAAVSDSVAPDAAAPEPTAESSPAAPSPTKSASTALEPVAPSPSVPVDDINVDKLESMYDVLAAMFLSQLPAIKRNQSESIVDRFSAFIDDSSTIVLSMFNDDNRIDIQEYNDRNSASGEDFDPATLYYAVFRDDDESFFVEQYVPAHDLNDDPAERLDSFAHAVEYVSRILRLGVFSIKAPKVDALLNLRPRDYPLPLRFHRDTGVSTVSASWAHQIHMPATVTGFSNENSLATESELSESESPDDEEASSSTNNANNVEFHIKCDRPTSALSALAPNPSHAGVSPDCNIDWYLFACYPLTDEGGKSIESAELADRNPVSLFETGARLSERHPSLVKRFEDDLTHRWFRQLHKTFPSLYTADGSSLINDLVVRTSAFALHETSYQIRRRRVDSFPQVDDNEDDVTRDVLHHDRQLLAFSGVGAHVRAPLFSQFMLERPESYKATSTSGKAPPNGNGKTLKWVYDVSSGSHYLWSTPSRAFDARTPSPPSAQVPCFRFTGTIRSIQRVLANESVRWDLKDNSALVADSKSPLPLLPYSMTTPACDVQRPFAERATIRTTIVPTSMANRVERVTRKRKQEKKPNLAHKPAPELATGKRKRKRAAESDEESDAESDHSENSASSQSDTDSDTESDTEQSDDEVEAEKAKPKTKKRKAASIKTAATACSNEKNKKQKTTTTRKARISGGNGESGGDSAFDPSIAYHDEFTRATSIPFFKLKSIAQSCSFRPENNKCGVKQIEYYNGRQGHHGWAMYFKVGCVPWNEYQSKLVAFNRTRTMLKIGASSEDAIQFIRDFAQKFPGVLSK